MTGSDRKTTRGISASSRWQIPPPRPPAQTSACEPWRELIEAQLKLKRNAIYQDLVDGHGFGHGYNSVKRFVATLRAREPEQFDRLEFAPARRRRSTTAKAH